MGHNNAIFLKEVRCLVYRLLSKLVTLTISGFFFPEMNASSSSFHSLYTSKTSTLTSPSEVGMAISLCVQISADRTIHSGGVADLTRFLTANSKFNATSLTISESLNGSTSRPTSGPMTFANVVSSPLRIIFHFTSVLQLSPQGLFLEWVV